MTKKRKLITALLVLVGVLFVAGVTAIATTNYGSSTDPLITLSYLNQTVKPALKSELDASVSTAKTELAAALDTKITQFKADIDGKIASSGGSAGTADTFTVVTLTNRQVVKCGAGTELMLRSGSATAYGGTSPRLVDSTDGSELAAAGAALAKNHMYMASAAGNGLRASASSVTVLIRGEYTVHSDL